jgi:anti-sigma B factor antagonist
MTDTAGQFRIQMRCEEDVYRITPHGELDTATTPILESALADAFQPSVRLIVLDLGDLTFVDGRGAATIARFVRKVEDSGRELQVVKAAPNVWRVFEVTQVDRQLEQHDVVAPAPANNEPGADPQIAT